MNLLYISNAIEDGALEDIIKNAKSTPSLAANKYHNLVMDGMRKNETVNITHLCIPPVSRKTSDRFFYKIKASHKDNITYRYVPIINVPVLRNIGIFIYLLFFLCMYSAKADAVVYDILLTTVALSLKYAKPLFSAPFIGIVTDVPGKRADNARGIEKLRENISLNLLKACDGYVFLTEYMNELINKRHKKYIVSEGLVDVGMKAYENTVENKYSNKVCMYAGSLKKVYGIRNLVEAFIKANIKDAELHVYGNGDYRDELAELCKQNNSIKYCGVKTNAYIVSEEVKASLLINPRPTDKEYTKYSFPSKNLEYMVSGTPLLTTKLPGMPKEYYQYVYLIDDESVDGLTQRISEILSKPAEELNAFGSQAKKWIIKEKNNEVQAKRILDLIGGLK